MFQKSKKCSNHFEVLQRVSKNAKWQPCFTKKIQQLGKGKYEPSGDNLETFDRPHL
jgi:hypothetical protein